MILNHSLYDEVIPVPGTVLDSGYLGNPRQFCGEGITVSFSQFGKLRVREVKPFTRAIGGVRPNSKPDLCDSKARPFVRSAIGPAFPQVLVPAIRAAGR